VSIRSHHPHQHLVLDGSRFLQVVLTVALLLCECVQGVSQVSQMVQYPADPSIDTHPVWVAHFAHPIEVEWVAHAVPAPKDWPRLLLQVGSEHPLNAALASFACVCRTLRIYMHVPCAWLRVAASQHQPPTACQCLVHRAGSPW
jgi:hypothetical protein